MTRFSFLQVSPRLIGALFLLFIALSIVHFSVIETDLLVIPDDPSRHHFVEGALFRFGIVIDLILFVVGLHLSVMLYLMLKNVQKGMALLALVFTTCQSVVSIVIEISSFAATHFSIHRQIENLQWIIELRQQGYLITLVFFSLGFLYYSILLFRARYIPNIWGRFGIVSCGAMLVCSLLTISLLSLDDIYLQIAASLVMLFQVGTGVMLVLKRPAH